MNANEFGKSLSEYSADVRAENATIFLNTASATLSSITDGSELTGSPGQPVDHGELKASWSLALEAPTLALIATDSPYAQSNEDGVARPGGGPYTQRSPVGGRFSVAHTISNIDRLIAAEVAKVRGRNGL